jgi:hypothetical protein
VVVPGSVLPPARSDPYPGRAVALRQFRCPVRSPNHARAPALTAISPGTNLLGRSRTAATRADGTGILLWPQPAFSGRASCPLVALGPTVTRPRLARKDCLTGPRLVLAAQLGTCYCTVAHAHTPNRTQRGRRGGGGLRNPLATSPSHSFFSSCTQLETCHGHTHCLFQPQCCN